MMIYLDDIRFPQKGGWTICRDAHIAIRVIEHFWDEITHISLDHDLGDEKTVGCGYDIVTFIEEYVFTHSDIKKVPVISVHSSNNSARVKMELGIKSIERMVSNRI